MNDKRFEDVDWLYEACKKKDLIEMIRGWNLSLKKFLIWLRQERTTQEFKRISNKLIELNILNKEFIENLDTIIRDEILK